MRAKQSLKIIQEKLMIVIFIIIVINLLQPIKNEMIQPIKLIFSFSVKILTRQSSYLIKHYFTWQFLKFSTDICTFYSVITFKKK